MIVAMLRISIAIVVLTGIVLVCALAIVVGLVHPKLTPRRSLDALGEVNRQSAALIFGQRP